MSIDVVSSCYPLPGVVIYLSVSIFRMRPSWNSCPLDEACAFFVLHTQPMEFCDLPCDLPVRNRSFLIIMNHMSFFVVVVTRTWKKSSLLRRSPACVSNFDSMMAGLACYSSHLRRFKLSFFI